MFDDNLTHKCLESTNKNKQAMSKIISLSQLLFLDKKKKNAASSKLLMSPRGTCRAEEDTKCLLVRTVEKGLECVTHFFFLFLTLITYTAALIVPLIPLVVEKRSNTKTLLHSLSSMWKKMPAVILQTPPVWGFFRSSRSPWKSRKTVWYQVGLSEIKALTYCVLQTVISLVHSFENLYKTWFHILNNSELQ